MGVTKLSVPHRFSTNISIDNNTIHLGVHDNEIDAAKAYDEIAKELSNLQLNFRMSLFYMICVLPFCMYMCVYICIYIMKYKTVYV
jgi:hypothetical protein